MDISVRTVGDYIVDDQSWLDSAEEVDTGVPITIDVSTLDASQYANGFLPSGCVIGLIGGTDPGADLAGAYNDTASDGREVAAGFLLGAVRIRTGATRVVGTLLRSGHVKPNQLPFQAGQTGGGFLDAAARTDLAAHFLFRTA